MLRHGLAVIDFLLAVVFVMRLVKLKREILTYRPPSPLPSRRAGLQSRMTITRWS